MTNLEELKKSIIDAGTIRGEGAWGKIERKTKRLVTAVLEEGLPAKSVLNDGLIPGMDVVGARFKKNEIYIPEVLCSARAFKFAMEILETELVKDGVKPIGKCIIGTVQGDLHDIGKNLVAMMLKGAGFEVIDLGVGVAPDKFVEQVKAQDVHVVGMSALLTTTMPGMEKAIQALKQASIAAKIMIGGAPVTQGYADKIGADGYAVDAASAVDMAKSLVS